MAAVRILVSGACGRMGSEVIRAVMADPDLELVGAADPRGAGQDAAKAAGLSACGVAVHASLAEALTAAKPDAAIDFTEPAAALSNALTMVEAGVRPVIGTTGISAEGLVKLRSAIESRGIAGLVAPNFAIGAVLLIKFAAAAARYLPDCEIIEFHHEAKKDAPSGTALYTAAKIAESRKEKGGQVGAVGAGDETSSQRRASREEEILIPGVRGGLSHDIPIHSVRLPGQVANQEVIFGGLGQTLTIRHDTIDRKCFMPGVVLAARQIVELTGFFYGLESILDV